MRQPLASFAATLLLATLAVACGKRGAEIDHGLRFGSAFRECAPWDGPAFHLVLGPSELSGGIAMAQHGLEVRIYDTPERVAGRSIRLSGFDGRGVILRCPITGECIPADRGVVRIRSTANDSIHGAIDAEWQEGARVRASFAAAWHEQDVVCG